MAVHKNNLLTPPVENEKDFNERDLWDVMRSGRGLSTIDGDPVYVKPAGSRQYREHDIVSLPEGKFMMAFAGKYLQFNIDSEGMDVYINWHEIDSIKTNKQEAISQLLHLVMWKMIRAQDWRNNPTKICPPDLRGFI